MPGSELLLAVFESCRDSVRYLALYISDPMSQGVKYNLANIVKDSVERGWWSAGRVPPALGFSTQTLPTAFLLSWSSCTPSLL